MECNIILPFIPVSVNASYRVSKNRVYKSKKMREFQKQMTDVFENYKSLKMLEGRLLVDITFEMADKRHRDLDNMLKSLLDSLEGRVFKNDNQIFEINAKKINDCDEFKTIIYVKEI